MSEQISPSTLGVCTQSPSADCCAYPHPVKTENWDVLTSSRVINGLGAASRIGELLAEQGARRALIVTDPGLRAVGIVDQLAATISAKAIAVTVHSEIPANPSTAALDAATSVARDCQADYVVALGGGSALDAAKAVALLAHTELSAEGLSGLVDGPVLPIAAIPTTAGTGAETNGFGVMENANQQKVYIGSSATVPALVLLDAELTTGLPAAVTASSGFDAIIHGAESLLSRGATALSRAYATESLRLSTGALRNAVADGSDIEARSQLMMGAHLAGRALTLSGLGLVHGIGHSITATIGTPHGVALAAIARPAMLFGIDAAPTEYSDLARALNRETPVSAVSLIADIAAEVALPTSLAEIGVTPELIDTIVTKTLADAVTTNTPRRPTPEELTKLLTRE